MPAADPEVLTADFWLTSPDGTESWTVPGQQLTRADITTQGLRHFARSRLGVEALVLHDGGLACGRRRAEVRLELAPESASPPSPPFREGPPLPALPRARPWQRPGWHRSTLDWLDAALNTLGERRLGEAEQVSSYDLACVLRVQTDGGSAYLKAGESGREAGVSAGAWARLPDLTAEVLARDERAGLLLTRAAGPSLHQAAGLDAWTGTGLARLQRGLSREAVEAGEAETHPFAELPRRLAALLSDPERLAGWGLGEDAPPGLMSTLEAARAAHGRVAELDLLDLAAHGDAHPMNVLLGRGGPVWFDWSEAGWAHPFTDAGWFFAWLSHPAREGLPIRQAHPDAVPVLWRAYLGALSIGGRSPHAREALLADALVVGLAQRAVTYDRKFRHWEGTVPGWRPMYVPYYLGLLRRHAEAP